MQKTYLENKTRHVAFIPSKGHDLIQIRVYDISKKDKFESIYPDDIIEQIIIPFNDEILNKIQSYKSVAALVKYSKAHRIEQTTQNNGVSSTPCPTPDPLPTTKATGQGIQTESNDSTSCPLITTNVPYDGNGSSGASPLFIDTETTGLSYKDEIVEIAIVDIDENIIFESLVKPSKPIPKKATDIHGISNEMVANSPTFAEIWNKLYSIIAGKHLCFYNAKFDTRMIYQSVIRSFSDKDSKYYYGKTKFEHLFVGRGNSPNVRCLMDDYAHYWGDWDTFHMSYTWQSLVKACMQQRLLVHDYPNHRAVGDAIKTARLYKHLVRKKAIS